MLELDSNDPGVGGVVTNMEEEISLLEAKHGISSAELRAHIRLGGRNPDAQRWLMLLRALNVP